MYMYSITVEQYNIIIMASFAHAVTIQFCLMLNHFSNQQINCAFRSINTQDCCICDWVCKNWGCGHKVCLVA